MKAKKSLQTKQWELQQRSGVDPHEKFNPEKLGMEDWGDGFHVHAEPVLIERGPMGNIVRTTPVSEAYDKGMFAKLQQDAEMTAKTVRPAPAIFKQENMVELLAGYLMTYYSRFKPNQLPYNPLYDGIPLSESKASKLIFEPGKAHAQLTHVPAHEVHEWLKMVLGKRASMINARTGKKGWSGDIETTLISFDR